MNHETGDSPSLPYHGYNSQNRLLGLELIRFIAAVAVLVWHYQHFAYISDHPVNFVRSNQPLYWLLSPFYNYGYYGVQVFWSISGFIFFWKYRESLSDKTVSGRTFFIRRLSRLYPLHLATLLVVLALQLVYHRLSGTYFVYQHNDVKHFFLQLLFAAHWGFQDGYSFNAPTWSVSVEILAYLLFFTTLRVAGKSWLVNTAVIAICTITISRGITNPVFDCLIFFYTGGLTSIIFKKAEQRNAFFIYGSLVITLLLTVPILYWFNQHQAENLWNVSLLIYTQLAVFLLARLYRPRGLIAKATEAFGNMTYSSYLIHFPIQLSIVTLFTAADLTIPFHNTAFFLSFLIGTLILAHVVYVFFEHPMQDRIRSTYRKRGDLQAPAT